MMHRNLLILIVCQALAFSAAPIVIIVGGFVGTKLAPSPLWATAPIAAMTVGVALFSIPASFIMKRIGRRLGFLVAALTAALAALVAAAAIAVENFALFCVAIFTIGANLAFVQQYRFAAAESVEAHNISKAVSWVLIGGILAGVLGPEIVKLTRGLLDYGDYTATFISLSIIYIAVASLILFLREAPVQNTEVFGSERPLRQVMAQPAYLVAVMAGMVAYGVMSMIMTATPVSMHVIDGHSLDITARVIQSHIIAMFLPSLFTGVIVGRLGAVRVMTIGVFAMLACVVLALISHEIMHYWSALVLLGVGWNFLFVGGTTLLTTTCRPAERFKAQATNDFMVFGTQAIASLSAGTVLHLASWEILNFLMLPVLIMTLLAILVLHDKVQSLLAQQK